MDRYWRFKWEHDGITVADWMLGESDWFDLFYNIFFQSPSSRLITNRRSGMCERVLVTSDVETVEGI